MAFIFRKFTEFKIFQIQIQIFLSIAYDTNSDLRTSIHTKFQISSSTYVGARGTQQTDGFIFIYIEYVPLGTSCYSVWNSYSSLTSSRLNLLHLSLG